MQSWMIGVVLGIILVGWCPALPSSAWCVLLATLGLAALCWKSLLARVASGLAWGCAVGLMHGNGLLQHRLVDECVGIPLTVTGTVSSLPSETRMLNYGVLGSGSSFLSKTCCHLAVLARQRSCCPITVITKFGRQMCGGLT